MSDDLELILDMKPTEEHNQVPAKTSGAFSLRRSLTGSKGKVLELKIKFYNSGGEYICISDFDVESSR